MILAKPARRLSAAGDQAYY